MQEFELASENFKNLVPNQVYNGTNITYIRSNLKQVTIHNGSKANWMEFTIQNLPSTYDTLIATNKDNKEFYIDIFNSFGDKVIDLTKDPLIGKNGLKITVTLNYGGESYMNLIEPLGKTVQIKNKGSGYSTYIDSTGAFSFTLTPADTKPMPTWFWPVLVLLIILLIIIVVILYMRFFGSGKVDKSVKVV